MGRISTLSGVLTPTLVSIAQNKTTIELSPLPLGPTSFRNVARTMEQTVVNNPHAKRKLRPKAARRFQASRKNSGIGRRKIATSQNMLTATIGYCVWRKFKQVPATSVLNIICI